jgi:prepilin-type N-terminal cleavage/methylation domain-containing protein
MQTDRRSSCCHAERGFSLLELLVVLGILVILAGILVPSIIAQREKNNRAICMGNLYRLGLAMSAYSKENRGEFPRVVYDAANHPRSYTAFTGAGSPDPFAKDSAVRPNDVTASLWLLVRDGFISSEYSPVTSVFICPSTTDTPDPLIDAFGNSCAPRQRSNFRGPSHLSYSYAMPFSDAPEYKLSADTLPWDFVVMADRNPGIKAPQDVTRPRYGDTPAELSVGNSRNHRGAGQYVLRGDGHVDVFQATPFCGHNHDNIYTAGTPQPSTQPTTSAATEPSDPTTRPGLIGKHVAPAWKTDSYLVPTESD